MRFGGLRAGAEVVVAAAMVGSGIARAETAAAGFAVTPAFGEVTVPSDTPEVQYAVELANQNASDQLFNLSVVDFGTLDENGGVAFLGSSASDLAHKYGLAPWLSLPETSVVVPAGGSVKVPVVVENRPDLAPGGHYGAVLAVAMTAGSGGNSVGLKQVLSSLILVTKQGGVRYGLRLAGETLDGSWWRLPSSVKQRFYNGGNVHVVPRGVVSVRDSRGHEVERAVINEDSEWVLPETYRRFKTTFLADGKAWLPGRYEVVASYRYDGTDKLVTVVSYIWYVGAVVVWVVTVLGVAAAGVLAWWLWRRRIA